MIAFLIFVAIVGVGFLFSKLVDNATAWAPVLVLGPFFALCVFGVIGGIWKIVTGDFSLESLKGVLACLFFGSILCVPVLGGFEWFERLGGNSKNKSGEGIVPESSAKDKSYLNEIDKSDMRGPSVYMKCPYCAVTLSFIESWIRRREGGIFLSVRMLEFRRSG